MSITGADYEEKLLEVAARKAQVQREAAAFEEEISRLEKQLDAQVKRFIKELRGLHASQQENLHLQADIAVTKLEQLKKLSDHFQSLMALVSDFSTHTSSII